MCVCVVMRTSTPKDVEWAWHRKGKKGAGMERKEGGREGEREGEEGRKR